MIYISHLCATRLCLLATRLQYDVYLDDEMLVSDAPFKGQAVQALGMYNYHHHAAWFDEIFVGEDDDQSFRFGRHFTSTSLDKFVH